MLKQVGSLRDLARKASYHLLRRTEGGTHASAGVSPYEAAANKEARQPLFINTASNALSDDDDDDVFFEAPDSISKISAATAASTSTSTGTTVTASSDASDSDDDANVAAPVASTPPASPHRDRGKTKQSLCVSPKALSPSRGDACMSPRGAEYSLQLKKQVSS